MDEKLESNDSKVIPNRFIENSKYNLDLTLNYHPDPESCELYYVNRDTLFSYNKVSEFFLQNMMSLYVSSHYKNEPNDLQLMSDAPAHQLYVLLPPQNDTTKKDTNKLIPDILAVIQISFEGNLTKKIIKSGLNKGKRLDGDLIPWVMSQQFQDDDFGRLNGARVVRIAVHPHVQSMGYGSRALHILTQYFEGKLINIDDVDENMEQNKQNEDNCSKKRKLDNSDDDDSPRPNKRRKLDGGKEENDKNDMSMPIIRSDLPPLLTSVRDRKPEKLHWLGVSYGLTLKLFKFWQRGNYKPVYLRGNKNKITGEYTCVMVKPLQHHQTSHFEWITSFTKDFQRRFMSLLSYEFKKLDIVTGLSVFDPSPHLLENNKSILNIKSTIEHVTYDKIMEMFTDWDLKRLDTYQRNLIDCHLVLDLVPKFVILFFTNKLDVQLNYTQCAILLGIGLQRKNVDTISAELGIIVQQTKAMLNKSIRRIYKYIDGIIKMHVETKEILPEFEQNKKNALKVNTNTLEDPMIQMKEELRKVAYKHKKKEMHKKFSEKKKLKLKKQQEQKHIIASVKEYHISDKLDDKIQEMEAKNIIPSSISIQLGKKEITLPKNPLSNAVDPQFFRNLDKAHGKNPNDKYHWNQDKPKSRKKRRGKGKKKQESKILEHSKKERGSNKMKRTREEHFVS